MINDTPAADKLQNIINYAISNFLSSIAGFKSGDFVLKLEKRPGQPKKFEDAELDAILEEDPCETLEELADAL